MTMLQSFLRRSEFFSFLLRLRAAEQGPIRLTQRRVYILPTGYGFTFAFALFLMLIGSINYTLGLGYLLTFSLAGMGLVSMLHSFRNLAHLVVRPGRVEPVFAGGDAKFELLVENPSRHDRFALLVVRDASVVDCDIPAQRTERVRIAVPAPRRGSLALGRVTLESRYPLGLFRVWSYVQPDASAIVYPRPDESDLPGAQVTPDRGEAVSAGGGSDDFSGLRPYQRGDSPRHVAWKAAERGGTLLTKFFSGHGAAELWLRWDELPAALDVEAKLSRLTRWILEADAGGIAFGLDIPGVRIAPALGDAHRETCLTRLALFDAGAPRS